MTAIAYKKGVLAADTQQFSGNLREGITEKIARRSDGALAGASGRADLDHQFLELFKSGRSLDEFKPQGTSEDDFCALVIEPDGSVWNYTALGKHPAGDAPFHTLGGAYPFLHGAMAAGASAEEAVRLATVHCSNCGGDVTVLRLNAWSGREPEPIDPSEWPVHERLRGLIDYPVTADYIIADTRITSWGSNSFHLSTRKNIDRQRDIIIEIPSLIAQDWGTLGLEESERAIDEGNACQLLMNPGWHPASWHPDDRLAAHPESA